MATKVFYGVIIYSLLYVYLKLMIPSSRKVIT